jgi:galactose oxidase-like protein
MTYPRFFHTATLLSNGKVLIDGGTQKSQVIPPVADELYDPSTRTFTATGVPLQERVNGMAVALKDGTVLILGGYNTALDGPILEDAEIYNPATGTFTGLGTITGALPRYDGTATLLRNGDVLIAGGTDLFDCKGGSLNTAALYHPPNRSFHALPNMVAGRDQTTATLLGNGKVLIAGGYNTPASCAPGLNCTSSVNAVDFSELYNPATGTFMQTGSMTQGRSVRVRFC